MASPEKHRRLSDRMSFIELKENTTAKELASQVTEFLATERLAGNRASVAEATWELLLHYIPLIYANSSGMHGEKPPHCNTLLNCIGYLLFNGDPDEGLANLQAKCAPPQVCGRVFRSGESTYLCLDCGMDMTCVLCSECFHSSAHKNHRYRMAATGGSGCCDCGDEEAWKQHAHCSIHKALEPNDTKNVILDPALQESAVEVLGQCLRYCVQALTWCEDGSPDWCTTEKSCLLLYNDEVHTFDEIIRLLTSSTTLGVTPSDASNLATIVDRDGRMAAFFGTREECEKLRGNFLTIARKFVNKPEVILKCFSYGLVVHQIFAILLLGWLEKISRTCGALQQVIRGIVLKGPVFAAHEVAEVPEKPCCLIDRIWSVGNVLWKVSRCEFQSFIMGLMTSDVHQKLDFAINFLNHYDTIQEQFLADDHEHSLSMAALSVQFLTAPTVAYDLLEHHNAFAIVTSFILKLVMKVVDEASGRVDMSMCPDVIDMMRFLHVTEDVKFLLSHPPLPWTSERRDWFMLGFNNVLKIFELIEGMEPFKRKFHDHVLYEPEWEDGFDLVLRFNALTRHCLKWIRSDETLLFQCIASISQRIAAGGEFSGFSKTVVTTRTRAAQEDPVTPSKFAVNTSLDSCKISVFWPLRRLLARLLSTKSSLSLRETMDKHCVKPTMMVEKLAHQQPEIVAQCLLESPLGIYYVSKQIMANLWKRNGMSLVSEMAHYENVACTMHDGDLAVLQTSACVLEPDAFVSTLVARLSVWPLPSTPPDSNDWLTNTGIFLNALVDVFGERYDNCVSDVTQLDLIERELLHVLFLRPLTHSEALKEGLSSPTLCAFADEDKDTKKIDKVLQKIASREPGRSGQGIKFALKEEHYGRASPFYYHYSRTRQSQAHMKSRELKTHIGLPCLPPFNERFRPLLGLLSSNLLHQVLKDLLLSVVTPGCLAIGDLTLHLLIYLIGQFCVEEECYIKGVDGRVQSDLKWSFMTVAAAKPTTSELNKDSTILQLLLALQQSEHSKDCRLLLQRVLEILTAFQKSQQPVVDVSMDEEALATSSTPSSTVSPHADEEKARRKKKAAEQRAKAMEGMRQLQKRFLTTASVTSVDSAGDGQDDVDGRESSVDLPTDERAEDKTLTCIFCQEDAVLGPDTTSFVMNGHCSISRLLGVKEQLSEDARNSFDPLLCSSNLPFGIFFHSCGHVMHSECYSEWLAAEVNSRSGSKRNTLARCPMCNSVVNLAMPVLAQPAYVPPTRSTDMMQAVDTLSSGITNLLAKQRELGSSQSSDTSSPAVGAITAESRRSSLEQALRSVVTLQMLLRRRAPSITDSTGAPAVPSDKRNAQRFASSLLQCLGERDKEVPESVGVASGTLAYGIMCLERVLHVDGRSVFGELPARMNLPYESLSALAFKLRCENVDQPLHLSSSECHLLQVLASLAPRSDGLVPLMDALGECVFFLEPFHLMVNLSVLLNAVAGPLASLVSEAKTGSVLFGLCSSLWQPELNRSDCVLISLRAAIVVNVIQTLILAKPSDVLQHRVESTEELPEGRVMAIWSCLRAKNLMKNWTSDMDTLLTEQHLVAYVEEALRPLLRRAALLLRFQGCSLPKGQFTHCREEFSVLANYLCLAGNISDILGDEISKCPDDGVSLVCRWANNLEEAEAVLEPSMENCPAKVAKTSLSKVCIPAVRGLIDLPNDYGEFIQRVSTLECPQAVQDGLLNKLVQHPAMCLVCGEFLCSMTYCCRRTSRVGNLTQHTKSCSGDVGIFLLIWDCNLLILAPPMGMLENIPYVDEYGEPASANSSTRAINPLFLDQGRYAELQNTWMRQGFLEKVFSYVDRNVHQFQQNVWQEM